MMLKYIISGFILLLVSGCAALQQLPTISLATDVSTADTEFTQIVAQIHTEYNKDNICASKLKVIQKVVLQGGIYIEKAYDAATLNNFIDVSKYLSRLNTLRRDLEFDLEIAKSGEPLNGCAGLSPGTLKFIPAFA